MRYRVAEDLSAGLQRALRYVERAARLDQLRYAYKHRCGHLGDRPRTDLWEDIRLQPAQHVLCVMVCACGLPLRMPRSGHRLEAAGGERRACCLGILASG